MKAFLKRLYQLRHERLHLIIWKNSDPDEPESFNLKPIHGIVMMGVVMLIVAFTINAIIFFTPLRFALVDYDQSFRNELLTISNRILELQDSLQVRDRQLANIRDVIRTTPDTSFVVSLDRETVIPVMDITGPSAAVSPTSQAGMNFMSLSRSPDISFEFNRLEEPLFPAPMPVSGIITANHNPAEGHFGIDIASSSGSPIRSIAAGVVIHTDWTINYGHTVKVQHLNGFVSVYKHVGLPSKNIGDFINKGDILGTVSDSGVLSSGPHLHFELWHNARPLNPVSYLIN